MEDNQKITDFLKGGVDVYKGHTLYRDGSIRIGQNKFTFKSKWNSARNFIGLIAAFNPATRLSDRKS